ncbi:hypothetical protein ACA503_001243 [Yersinia enterocolitica]|nr:hypothetical protein [Yersinia enterocolitica]HDQ4039445.1 hypothetical protein [Yersinia enterocolitica]HEI6857794.1 hypothetical protein [Yersinia enterocolitica]
MKGINFPPFVGDKYYDSCYGIRVMVLGESHYGDGSDSVCNFTQYVVKEHALKAGQAFFSKLTNLLRGHIDYPTEEERIEIWKHVAFYNYIQEFVGEGARIAPTPEMWKAAYVPFLEVVKQLEPNVILVLGSRLWDEVPELPPAYPVEWCGIIHPSSRMAYEPSIAALAESIKKAGGIYPKKG